MPASAEVIADLRRARDVMDRDFADEEMDLNRIAAAAFMSRSHFTRQFTRQFHISPAAYLSRRRLERAQDLLRYANLTITEVCHAVGYTALGSFSSAFRARVGETPSQFQQRWRARDRPKIPGCVILMWGPQRCGPTAD